MKAILELEMQLFNLEKIAGRTNELIKQTKKDLSQLKKLYGNLDSNELQIERLLTDEAYRIQFVLNKFNGSRKLTAKYLGISERTMYRMIKANKEQIDELQLDEEPENPESRLQYAMSKFNYDEEKVAEYLGVSIAEIKILNKIQ